MDRVLLITTLLSTLIASTLFFVTISIGVDESVMIDISKSLGIENLKDLLETIQFITVTLASLFAIRTINHWIKPQLFEVKLKDQIKIIKNKEKLKSAINSEISILKHLMEIADEEDQSKNQLIATRDSFERRESKFENSLSGLRKIAHDFQTEKYSELLETPSEIENLMRGNGYSAKRFFVAARKNAYDIISNIENRIQEIENPHIFRKRHQYSKEKVNNTINQGNEINNSLNKITELLKKDRDI